MANRLSRKYIKVIIDSLLLLCVFSCVFLVRKFWPRFERGMFCFDQTLALPYIENDTVSDSIMLFIGVVFPLVVISAAEYSQSKDEAHQKEFETTSSKCVKCLKKFFKHFGIFLFGCSASQLITDVAKYSLGALRPHFIEVCQPDWSAMNCTIDKLPTYVNLILCTNPDLKMVEDARFSFPSAHASFSTFTMLYLIIYLQKRVEKFGTRLVRPLLQLLLLMFAFYTCLSRIFDYKHHWYDVVAGCFVGATMAFFTTFISQLEKKEKNVKNIGSPMMLQDYTTFNEIHNTHIP